MGLVASMDALRMRRVVAAHIADPSNSPFRKMADRLVGNQGDGESCFYGNIAAAVLADHFAAVQDDYLKHGGHPVFLSAGKTRSGGRR